jgi:predicted GTPase
MFCKLDNLFEARELLTNWIKSFCNCFKYIKIKYVQQLPTHSPAFAIFCNLPQYVPESYKRFLENRLREQFDFEGVPVKIFFRKK